VEQEFKERGSGTRLALFSLDFYPGFVRVLENLESHGILLFSFPGLVIHGILCRVMESYGKLNHFKKIMSRSLLCIMIDKNFTECILLNYE